MTTQDRFESLRQDQALVDEISLETVFDALEPVACEDILSRWRGGGFDTGHWLLPALGEMKWFGKWFVAPADVKPLICWAQGGNLVSSQAMNGEASLATIDFRGKVSAAIVYDGVPLIAHLRRVDDDTLLGMVTGKAINGTELVQEGKHQYFFLERIAQWPAPLVS